MKKVKKLAMMICGKIIMAIALSAAFVAGYRPYPIIMNKDQRAWAKNPEDAISLRLGGDINSLLPERLKILYNLGWNLYDNEYYTKNKT